MATSLDDSSCEECLRDLSHLPLWAQIEVIRGCSQYSDLTKETQDYIDGLFEQTLENYFDSNDGGSGMSRVFRCVSNQWKRNYTYALLNRRLIEDANVLYSKFKSADCAGTVINRRNLKQDIRGLFKELIHGMFPDVCKGCINHQHRNADSLCKSIASRLSN